MKNFYKKLLISLAFLGMSNATQAEEIVSDAVAVRAVVDQIFDAMRSGDSATIIALILPEAALDRISPNKPIEHGVVSDWTNWVATLKPGQADEQIFDVTINVEGPLATVWAPFTIAIDGVMKSCGINHFTLVKTDGGWKVAYLIDTHTPEKCPME
jgi:ketosteroid isomerase-like protein